MFKTHVMIPLAALTLVSGLCLSHADAQDGGRQRQRGDRQQAQGQRGGERGGERGGMENFRQRMNDRIKESLSVSDEEWSVLQPRIEKVQQLQMQTRAIGGMGGFGGRQGGPGGPGGPGAGPQNAAASQTPVAKASVELRTAVQDKAASADTIKTKLAALRAARAKAQEDLTKAQGELRELLDSRQEAQLVLTGLLD